MKTLCSLSLGLAFVSQTSGHYIFQRFSYGGITYPVNQFIRPNTNYNSPITDLESTDLRCNQGGLLGTQTQTLTVRAGDAFSFTSDTAVYHNGPVAIYMAKAPGTAASFDGSGQVWFKILDIGPTFPENGGNVDWHLAQVYTYRIPPALPNGDYLIRIQSLAIHNPYPSGIPQFYIGCAQVTVTNGGNGTPGPLVSIPGFITGTESGYTANIYGNNFRSYEQPGPPVWAGQSGGGSGGTTTRPASTSSTRPATTSSSTRPASTSSSTRPASTSSSTRPASTSSTTRPTSTTFSTTTRPASSTSRTSTSATASPTGAVVPKYGQCGGQGWTGGTVCAAGTTCTFSNTYYSQCL